MKLFLIACFTIINSQGIKAIDFNFIRAKGFEENLGQIYYSDNKPANEVKYVFKQGNLKIFLLNNGLAYQLEKYEQDTTTQTSESASAGSEGFSKLSTYRMDMELLGANPNAEIIAEGKSDDYTNYYQPDLIQTYSYQKIIYKNVYPGIDWVVYIDNRHAELVLAPESNEIPKQVRNDDAGSIKYDFIVHPGADPSQIKLKYKNAEQIYLDQYGNLILRNRLGDIKEDAPIAFQNPEKIIANYLLKDSIVRFHIKNYDKNQTLIIDPQLEWSTYYGGTSFDLGFSVKSKDSSIYLCGGSGSSSAIAYNGFQNTLTSSVNLFLVKFNLKGIRIWATYYGSGSEAQKCLIDNKHNIILVGTSSDSANNYAHNGFQTNHGGGGRDVLIVKFDSLGSRIWASYIGGSGNDMPRDSKLDHQNNLYIAGTTASKTGIAFNGYQDTFYTKFDASGGLIPNNFIIKIDENCVKKWASYYGIAATPYLAIDDSFLYLSSNFSDTNLLFTESINTSALTTLFIAKFKFNGTRIYGKPFYHLNFPNYVFRGFYKHKSLFYLISSTVSIGAPMLSTGFKTTPSGASEVVILKIDSNLNTVWSSYYGGNSIEIPLKMTFDKFDNFYISGITRSTTGLFYRGLKNTYSGIDDIFLAKVSKNGNLLWSSYFGGNNIEQPADMSVDIMNNFYMTGFTRSSTGISYNGHQDTFGGLDDAFLMKISCNHYDTIRDTICRDDTLLYRSKKYSQAGFYTDSFLTWDICDSFITLHLTVLRKDTTHLYDTICSGSSYVWNGMNKTVSGVYRDTLVNNVGCDSFLILNLVVKRTDTVQVYDTLCHNLPKTFNGQNLTMAGVYRDTLKNMVGCDSHIFYHFIPKPIYETPLSRAICASDSSLFGGKYYKQGGIYYDTLKTAKGCDSLLKLTLTINPLDTNKQTQSICRGKSYNFYSQVLTSQGTYSHKFTNRNGCDSLILLTLALKDTSTYALNRTICKNQFYSFNNQNLNTAGVYRDTLINAAGCDSFITLTLLTNGTVSNTIEIIRCHGDIYQGYTQSGTYDQTLTSHLGCDSLLTIKLTYLPATEYKTISHSKCGAFMYGSRTYTQNDSFTETIKNYLNCDSIVTRHFVYITEPQPKFLADKTIEFCEEIMHKGQLKTTSFFTQDTVKSLEFPYCDSLYQPIFYRRENRPVLTAISKQIDTVIKGETTNIQVSGAQNYRWTTGEQSSTIRPQITEDKTFEVTAWNLADCEEKIQFRIYAIDQPLIDFPTAFSPNGDGLNDYFYPNTNGNITIDYFQIYNRWGEKVYEHSPLSKGWDGSYLGKPAANGLYTYTLRYSYLGRIFTRSGEVMMVR